MRWRQSSTHSSSLFSKPPKSECRFMSTAGPDKKTEMIVSNSGPQIEVADPVFNWVHTPSDGAVWKRAGAAQQSEPNTVYYLKHPGPNLSLWRAHHKRTSFLKCTFHAACQSHQSGGGGGRLHRFPSSCFSAPIPTDKMSQFPPNGSPIGSNEHRRTRRERPGLPADACRTAGHSPLSRLI